MLLMVFSSSIAVIIFAVFFSIKMGKMPYFPLSGYSVVKFGALELGRIANNFLLFRYLGVGENPIFKNDVGGYYYFCAYPKIPGVPFSVSGFLFKNGESIKPKMFVDIGFIKEKANGFYGADTYFYKKSELKNVYYAFGKSYYFSIRSIWVEKNEHGCLIVVPGNIKNEHFVKELDEFFKNN